MPESENIKSIVPGSLEQPVLHQYLLSAVAPRPVAFASTIDKDGKVNLSPFSFFNVFSSNPPVMIFSPARRGRDNTTKDTYQNIREVPEVVINIVNYAMVEQMSLASAEYEKGVNEFTKAGFTETASLKVSPPRVKESPVSFECEVDRVIALGEEGGAGNLVLARVLMIHIREEYLNEDGTLNILRLDQVARMGGNWYCRASGDALFEIPKPGRIPGIGVDALPESIRTSPILTGNDLGRLGGLPSLPGNEEIRQIREQSDVKKALEASFGDDPAALHRMGKKYIEEGRIAEALAIMIALK